MMRQRIILNCSRFAYLNLKKREQTTDSTSQFANNSYEDYFKEHHVPINGFQRAILTLGSATMALVNPYRGDMVACLGETTGSSALDFMLSQMEESTEGLQILKEKPRINTKTINLEELRSLPDNTLGKAYINFLDDNKVTPDTRDPVKFVDDYELAYVMQRYREIHDFAHAILGMDISILGELTIKWFEAVQNKLPMCFGGAIFGSVQLDYRDRRNLLKYNLPWAIETAQRSKFLMNVYFEKRFEQPLNDLRKELNITTLLLPRNR